MLLANFSRKLCFNVTPESFKNWNQLFQAFPTDFKWFKIIKNHLKAFKKKVHLIQNCWRTCSSKKVKLKWKSIKATKWKKTNYTTQNNFRYLDITCFELLFAQQSAAKTKFHRNCTNFAAKLGKNCKLWQNKCSYSLSSTKTSIATFLQLFATFSAARCK